MMEIGHSCSSLGAVTDVYEAAYREGRLPIRAVIDDYPPDDPDTSVIQDMAEYGVIAATNGTYLTYDGEERGIFPA